jgi:hypothetical protein
MKINRYESWKPVAELPKSPYFFELHHSEGELTVLLKEFDYPGKTLVIKFAGVIGYRVVIEAGRLNSLNNSSLLTFCQTQNSDFLTWTKEESGGIFDESVLIHYVMWNIDNIIDVISGPPMVATWQ